MRQWERKAAETDAGETGRTATRWGGPAANSVVTPQYSTSAGVSREPGESSPGTLCRSVRESAGRGRGGSSPSQEPLLSSAGTESPHHPLVGAQQEPRLRSPRMPQPALRARTPGIVN